MSGVDFDLCDVNLAEVGVSNIVFSNKHTDVGQIFALKAMGRGEDVAGGDEGSSTKGGLAIAVN